MEAGGGLHEFNVGFHRPLIHSDCTYMLLLLLLILEDLPYQCLSLRYLTMVGQYMIL